MEGRLPGDLKMGEMSRMSGMGRIRIRVELDGWDVHCAGMGRRCFR
jgi:hypothetical protein